MESTPAQPFAEHHSQHVKVRKGIAVVAVEEAERLRVLAGGRHELHAVFLHEGRLSHAVDEAQPLERLEAEERQRFANVAAGNFSRSMTSKGWRSLPLRLTH